MPKRSIEHPLVEEYFQAMLNAAAAAPARFSRLPNDHIHATVVLTDGNRAWHLRFADGRLLGHEPSSATPGTRLLMTRKTLAALLAGKLAPAHALATRRIACPGNNATSPPFQVIAALLAAMAEHLADDTGTIPVQAELLRVPAGNDHCEVLLYRPPGTTFTRLLAVFPGHPMLGDPADALTVAAVVRGGLAAGHGVALCHYRGVTNRQFRGEHAQRDWWQAEARDGHGALANDARAILQELAGRVPAATTLDLAGHGFGAMVALLAAAQSPFALRRALLVCPAPASHDFSALHAAAGAIPLRLLAPALEAPGTFGEAAALALRLGARLRLLPVEEHRFHTAAVLLEQAIQEALGD